MRIPSLVVKPIYPADQAEELWKSRNDVSYPHDGLIFTPDIEKSVYYSRIVLKWIPPEMMTIDFAIGEPIHKDYALDVAEFELQCWNNILYRRDTCPFRLSSDAKTIELDMMKGDGKEEYPSTKILIPLKYCSWAHNHIIEVFFDNEQKNFVSLSFV